MTCLARSRYHRKSMPHSFTSSLRVGDQPKVMHCSWCWKEGKMSDTSDPPMASLVVKQIVRLSCTDCGRELSYGGGFSGQRCAACSGGDL